jgi:hypothetical protein
MRASKVIEFFRKLDYTVVTTTLLSEDPYTVVRASLWRDGQEWVACRGVSRRSELDCPKEWAGVGLARSRAIDGLFTKFKGGRVLSRWYHG